MNEEEQKTIILGNCEAVITLEEINLQKDYETINLKRQLLNMMRDLSLDECLKLVPNIIVSKKW